MWHTAGHILCTYDRNLYTATTAETSYLSSMLAYSKPIRIIIVLTVVDAVILAAVEDVCLLQATFTHNQILTGNAFNIL
jgi:hypothetical protein